jgi:hypothetical protein
MKQIAFLAGRPEIHPILSEDLKDEVPSVRRPAPFLGIYAVGEQPRAELVRYDAKSGQFLPYLDGASITDVSFSPDGHWLAYVTYPDGILWRSRVNGTQKLQLTSAGPGGALSCHGGLRTGSRSLFQAGTLSIPPACK